MELRLGRHRWNLNLESFKVHAIAGAFSKSANAVE